MEMVLEVNLKTLRSFWDPLETPPTFMANAILNFHFDFLHPSLICWVDQNSQNSTKTDFRVPKMPPIKRCISMCGTPMQADLDPTNWWGVRQGQNGLNLASEDKCDLKKWCCVINEFEGLQEKLAELINLYKRILGTLPTNKHIIQLLQWLQILQDLPPEWSWRADPTVRSQMCNALEFYFTQSESLGNQISESWAACSQ